MKHPVELIVAVFALAAGTFAFRLAGPLLSQRMRIPAKAEQLLRTSAVVLLAALIATATLYEGHRFAGVARPAGVLVAGILAWRKAPFAVVILVAAGTTALLRLLSVS